jgi:hypothetical protein
LPTIGELPVASIDTGLLLTVLEPIWATKTVAAKRIRDNMECLDYATARGQSTGENPARWKDALIAAQLSFFEGCRHTENTAEMPKKGTGGPALRGRFLCRDFVPVFPPHCRLILPSAP